SEIKERNRGAEATTTSAEAVSAVASLFGYKYPREALRRNWEDICFNHHHDTLPGSGIHAGYDRTVTVLDRVVADDKDIITRALETLVIRVTPRSGGINVLVFNPTGWTRSGWIQTYDVRSGWDRTEVPDPDRCVAEAPDGKTYPVTLEDGPSRRVRFWAADVPPFGYRVFRLVQGESKRPAISVRDDGATVETDKLVVAFDKDHGCIRSLVLKATGKDLCGSGLGRMEAHFEGNHNMSAWTLGRIEKVTPLSPTSAKFSRGVDFAQAVFTYVLPAWNDLGGSSTITQTFRIPAEGDEVTCDVDCVWNGVGSPRSANALLRVAFGTKLDSPTATYHVPFG
ncbi:MAG: glycoside hydrolase family 38 C-terminal domain-containing protein, partial [Armatimonadota bacterium]